jgi:DNA repair protein RAD5
MIDLDGSASDAAAPAAPAAAAAAAASSSTSADAKPSVPSAFFDVTSSRAKHRRLYMNHNGVVGSTLVVCPMSLLSQWRDEVAKFTSLDSVYVYYGAAKDRRKVDFSLYDVVLTSYGVIAAENRAVVQAQNAANASATANGSAATPLSNKAILNLSPLMGTNFWRIVLDESHIIRNRSTETAKAIFALRGERRWAVSGTIIQNRIDDVFAPLLFLKEEPWSSWGWWSTVISQPFEKQDPVALQRLRAVLGPLMLRRTKSMRTATGKSIVELPPRVDETLQCEFSEEERDFYTALYNRSRTQFEGFVSAGTATSKYIQILTLLLRLRQCCDHPYLVLGKEKTDKDFEADINRFIHRFVSRVDLRAEGAPTIQFLESLTNDLKKKKGATEDVQECSICLCPPETPVLTECAHLYCRDCINPIFNDRGLARCPLCRSVIDISKLFLVPEAAPAIRIDAQANWKHSSKTLKLLEELRAVRTGEDPTAKIVIFSQWTSMLDLLEIPLKQEKFPFLRLDGSLTQKERETVLRKFDKDPEARILLVSLKAGQSPSELRAALFRLGCSLTWALFCCSYFAFRRRRSEFGRRLVLFLHGLLVESIVSAHHTGARVAMDDERDNSRSFACFRALSVRDVAWRSKRCSASTASARRSGSS